MVDGKGVCAHLRELKASLEDWERYRKAFTRDDIVNSRDKRNMACHALLISIQASLDIASHIISEESFRKPCTYRESFEILREHGFLDGKTSLRMENLAGFRNRLVHMYVDIDFDLFWEILSKELPAVREFAGKAAAYIDRV